MGTSKDTIRGWLDRGKRDGATHVIVVCDTFDHDDYPVFVMPYQNVHVEHDKHDGKNMQRVMEVYALHLDFESQLREHRAFHFETIPVHAGERMAKRRHVTPPPEPISGGLKFGAVQDLTRARDTVITVRSVTMTTPEAATLEPRYQAVRAALDSLIAEVKRMVPKPDPEREAAASSEDDLDGEFDGDDV